MKHLKIIAIILTLCILSSMLSSCMLANLVYEIVNNPKVNITLPSCPTIIHEYSFDGEIEATIEITDIRCESSAGYAYTTIYFTGEKTYDINGDDYNRYSSFSWKLYDSENYVVDSGSYSTAYISVGDKFKDEAIDVWATLDPDQTYNLVISSYNSGDETSGW